MLSSQRIESDTTNQMKITILFYIHCIHMRSLPQKITLLRETLQKRGCHSSPASLLQNTFHSEQRPTGIIAFASPPQSHRGRHHIAQSKHSAQIMFIVIHRWFYNNNRISTSSVDQLIVKSWFISNQQNKLISSFIIHLCKAPRLLNVCLDGFGDILWTVTLFRK